MHGRGNAPNTFTDRQSINAFVAEVFSLIPDKYHSHAVLIALNELVHAEETARQSMSLTNPIPILTLTGVLGNEDFPNLTSRKKSILSLYSPILRESVLQYNGDKDGRL